LNAQILTSSLLTDNKNNRDFTETFLNTVVVKSGLDQSEYNIRLDNLESAWLIKEIIGIYAGYHCRKYLVKLVDFL